MLHTICKHIQVNDVVICPDGDGNYKFGIIKGSYYYKNNSTLPHRRDVDWLNVSIPRSQLSEPLQRSTGSIATLSNISKYSLELEKLISGESTQQIFATDITVEDPSAFAMEKHLEDFLVIFVIHFSSNGVNC